jgi:hypothetical protein
VLLAASGDWVAASRLPALLGKVGFEVHLIDPGQTHASSSSWLTCVFSGTCLRGLS